VRRDKSLGRLGAPAFAILCLLPSFSPGPAGAQGIPPEIPLTDRVGVGARAMGMGGAYTAAADDATALYYNPAALARVERIELSTTVFHHRIEESTDFLGRRSDKTVSPTRINQLGFVYPFPTYRGSLVVGMGFHRLTTLDRDFFRASPDGMDLVAAEDEAIFESGAFSAWTAGLAWDASPRVSLGASATLLSGTSYLEREYHYVSVNGNLFEHSLVTDETDFEGVTGSVGALVRWGDGGRFALVIDLPRDIRLDGTAFEDVYRYDGLDTTDVYDEFVFEDDVTLPFSTTLGLSWNFGDVLLAGDLQFTDWNQLEFSGPLRTPPPDREFAYREVLSVRVGGEYRREEWPVRLRGGFGYDPVPYKIILTDVFNGGFEEADYAPQRYEIAMGAGALLEDSFTVDVAYTHRWFERTGTGILEGKSEDKVYMGAAFRF
jgi:hypothetical protein